MEFFFISALSFISFLIGLFTFFLVIFYIFDGAGPRSPFAIGSLLGMLSTSVMFILSVCGVRFFYFQYQLIMYFIMFTLLGTCFYKVQKKILYEPYVHRKFSGIKILYLSLTSIVFIYANCSAFKDILSQVYCFSEVNPNLIETLTGVFTSLPEEAYTKYFFCLGFLSFATLSWEYMFKDSMKEIYLELANIVCLLILYIACYSESLWLFKLGFISVFSYFTMNAISEFKFFYRACFKPNIEFSIFKSYYDKMVSTKNKKHKQHYRDKVEAMRASSIQLQKAYLKFESNRFQKELNSELGSWEIFNQINTGNGSSLDP